MIKANGNKGINTGTTRAGFTLIETIISIVIISMAVIGLFAVFTTSIASRTGPQPFEIAVGAQYVQEGLEKVYADRRNPLRGFGYIVSANYPAEPSLGGGFARTTAIGAWAGGPQTDYLEVAVTATHNGVTVASGVLLVAKYPW